MAFRFCKLVARNYAAIHRQCFARQIGLTLRHVPGPALEPGANRALSLGYFGGGGVKISRLRPGSGFGFGLGAFFVSFLPLSLFPMQASMTQKVRF